MTCTANCRKIHRPPCAVRATIRAWGTRANAPLPSKFATATSLTYLSRSANMSSGTYPLDPNLLSQGVPPDDRVTADETFRPSRRNTAAARIARTPRNTTRTRFTGLVESAADGSHRTAAPGLSLPTGPAVGSASLGSTPTIPRPDHQSHRHYDPRTAALCAPRRRAVPAVRPGAIANTEIMEGGADACRLRTLPAAPVGSMAVRFRRWSIRSRPGEGPILAGR